MKNKANREFEIKLLLPEGHDSAKNELLVRSSLVKTQNLSTVYFDTSDWSLRKGGASLRIRSDGETIEQTCKFWEGNGDFNRVNRQECSCLLVTPDIDLAAFPSKLQSRIKRLLSGKALQSYADISTARQSGLISFGESLIEVSKDEVTISAAHEKRRFFETELELKQGKAADVFRFILALDHAPQMHWSVRSKADRGYALAAGVTQTAQKANDIKIDRAASVAQAFRKISWSCLNQLLGNYLLVIESRDMEALHQSRVAIRRLSSAMSIFCDFVSDELYGQLYEEWRNAAKTLGAARDLDILITRFENHVSESEAPVLARLADDRIKSYDDACSYLASQEFQRLLHVTAIWLEEGDWAETETIETSRTSLSIHSFSQQYFREQHHKLEKHTTDLKQLSPSQRHRLRIRMKKLGYAVDFFQSISTIAHGQKAHAKMVRSLSKLKDQLGELNDILAGQRWAEMTCKSKSKNSSRLKAGMEEFRHSEIAREEKLLIKASITLKSLQKSVST